MADGDVTNSDSIEEAVQISVLQFEKEHPATCKVLTARLGDPITFIIDGLKRDAAYQALVKQTDKEVELANVIGVLVPMILRIAERVLGLL